MSRTLARTLALALGLAAATACSKKEAKPAAAPEVVAGSGSNASPAPVRRVQPAPPIRKPGTEPDTGEPVAPGAGAGSGSAGAGSGRPPLRGHLGRAGREAYFDRDGNGKIDAKEREAMQLARSNALMRRIDTDNNGAITQAELDGSRFNGLVTSFSEADADKNGTLSHAEIGAAMEKARNDRLARRGRPGGSGAGSGSAAP